MKTKKGIPGKKALVLVLSALLLIGNGSGAFAINAEPPTADDAEEAAVMTDMNVAVPAEGSQEEEVSQEEEPAEPEEPAPVQTEKKMKTMAIEEEEPTVPVAVGKISIKDKAETYDTLASAVKAASAGDIIVLNEDLTGEDIGNVTNALTIEKNLTIDLDRHTIDANGNAGIFTVPSGEVTIKNGTLKNSSDSAIKATGTAETTLNLADLAITDCSAVKGGAVNATPTKKEIALNISDCRIIGNTADYGGGIYTYGLYMFAMGKLCKVVLNVTDSDISGNTARRGGGMELQSVTTLTNVTVTGNTATGTKGYKGVVDSSGSIWSSVSNSDGGGGIYACVDSSNSDLFVINGGKITENEGNAGLGDGLLLKCTGSGSDFHNMIQLNGDLTIGNNSGSKSQIGMILPSSYYKNLANGQQVKLMSVSEGVTLPGNLSTGVQVYQDSARFLIEVVNDGGRYLAASRNDALHDIYVDGAKGNDSTGDGTEEKPFKTYKKAEESLSKFSAQASGIVIYVKGTLQVSGDETWPTENWKDDGKVVVQRASGFKGAMVNIPGGATLTLGGKNKGIVLDGDKITAANAMIENSGTLHIHDGAVLQNNIHSHSTGTSYSYKSGGAVYSYKANVTMDGGVIQDNTTTSYGGGIEVYGGTFKFSGGTIRNNKVTRTVSGRTSGWSAGGGVSVLYDGRMEMTGGTVKGNSSTRDGGGIAIGTGENSTYNYNTSTGMGAKLIMDGGSIDGNTSGATGGGLFIECYTSADVTGGSIINNKAVTSSSTWTPNYGGGGVYVNGDRTGTAPSGVLNLKNVVVTENTGSTGGGLAACWTSLIKIYLTDGGAIYDNDGKYEVYINRDGPDEGVFGTYSELSASKVDSVDISNYMLGGGAYRWKDENGNYIPLNAINETYRMPYRLNSDPTAASKKAAEAKAKVFISGNSSKVGGGGIGTNGTVIIGSPNPEHIDINATKKWNDSSFAAKLENVNIWLFRSNKSTPMESVGRQELFYYISSRGDHVENGAEAREWKNSVLFQDLPKKDAAGEDYDYMILEEYILSEGVGENEVTHVWSANGKAYAKIVDEIMDDTPYIWSDDTESIYDVDIDQSTGTITNTPAADIQLDGEKTVRANGPYQLKDDEFSFQLTEVDAAGKALPDAYTETVGNKADGSITFSKIRYLEEGTHYYQITEVVGKDNFTYDDAVYLAEVTVSKAPNGNLIAEKTIRGADGEEVDFPQFTNIYHASGETTMEGQKVLEGATLADGQFSFVLKDAEGNELQKVVNYEDGSIVFAPIKYSETDAGYTYTYTVSEEAGDVDGMTYDDALYEVEVSVEDNGDGTLTVTQVITVDGEDTDEIIFTNEYEPRDPEEPTEPEDPEDPEEPTEPEDPQTPEEPTEPETPAEPDQPYTGKTAFSQFEARKIYLVDNVALELSGGEFDFTLTEVDEEGNPLTGADAFAETVTNDADGDIVFDEIEYTEAGTHYYQIAELNDGDEDITYDETVYTIRVDVEDSDDEEFFDITETMIVDGDADMIPAEITFTNRTLIPEEDVYYRGDDDGDDEEETTEESVIEDGDDDEAPYDADKPGEKVVETQQTPKSGNPFTGDTANIILWAVILLAACGLAIAAGRRRRKDS